MLEMQKETITERKSTTFPSHQFTAKAVRFILIQFQIPFQTAITIIAKRFRTHETRCVSEACLLDAIEERAEWPKNNLRRSNIALHYIRMD